MPPSRRVSPLHQLPPAHRYHPRGRSRSTATVCLYSSAQRSLHCNKRIKPAIIVFFMVSARPVSRARIRRSGFPKFSPSCARRLLIYQESPCLIHNSASCQSCTQTESCEWLGSFLPSQCKFTSTSNLSESRANGVLLQLASTLPRRLRSRRPQKHRDQLRHQRSNNLLLPRLSLIHRVQLRLSPPNHLLFPR